MATPTDFRTMHGCYCSGYGSAVARRNVELHTRVWEVDVLHEETGNVHTNVVRLGEPVVSKEGYRWTLQTPVPRT